MLDFIPIPSKKQTDDTTELIAKLKTMGRCSFDSVLLSEKMDTSIILSDHAITKSISAGSKLREIEIHMGNKKNDLGQVCSAPDNHSKVYETQLTGICSLSHRFKISRQVFAMK